MNGTFVISLDFELFWGIRDKYSYQEYGENVLGVWEAVPRLLNLFQQNDIHSTWATVGFLMCKDRDELAFSIPDLIPSYKNSNLSPYYQHINELTNNFNKYHFGKELLQLIKTYPNQEIATHTLSHYYAMEPSQTIKEFESDLVKAIEIAKKNKIIINSIVFPRHQINKEYFSVLKKYNIKIYRETEKIWYHSADLGENESLLKRIIRYADYFIKLGSNHCQDFQEIKKEEFFAIRASRWLRPYSEKLKYLDYFKIKRIKNQMTYAAKNNKVFHLWFHPHDVGVNQEINFRYLEEIFAHFNFLKNKYNFKSLNMNELANSI